MKIKLLNENGNWFEYSIPKQNAQPTSKGPFNRIAYAAVHVVPKKGSTTEIDWEASINYRKRIWSFGLGVAEAMDTAQRGMGLTYGNAKELIRRSIAASKNVEGALLACGCSTDQIVVNNDLKLGEVVAAYKEQIDFVEGLGGKVILMASRALASCAKSPHDYKYVYDEILNHVKQPVIIHWLGEMFDPALKGYWGSNDHFEAMDIVNEIMTQNVEKVDGIKVSLLDKEKEVMLRDKLPKGVKMYTGDDFNYPELIAGDENAFSHALLGIFDAIAPAASAALGQLTKDNSDTYFEIFNPTVPLSRHIFSAPTRFYKTGVVFLAWLNGFQHEFKMIDGQESARSKVHLSETFRLACEANALIDMDLAVRRMKQFLGQKE
ncbi:MAG: dihydrodipicolinate synthase family protein [Bacteroidia bacterium]